MGRRVYYYKKITDISDLMILQNSSKDLHLMRHSLVCIKILCMAVNFEVTKFYFLVMCTEKEGHI